MTTKRALIIGSEGNIGKPLSSYLRDVGYEVMEADIKPGWRPNYHVVDINQPIDLLPAFSWSPSVVFLLSAMVSRVTCEQASALAVSTNLAGTNNILQLCKHADVPCVYFSTSEVYGPRAGIMDEADPNPMPNNRYGLTKYLGEKLVEYEVEHSGLRAVTLRPFMIYDENEDFGDHRSAMIRFAYNLAASKPIEVHKGSARGWLHVSDAVKAIEAAAHVSNYTIINIGSSEIYPMIELAEMICKELGASRDLIKEIEIPKQMTLIKRPNLTRMRDILGVVPQISIEEGVKRVCERVRRHLARRESLSV